VGSTLDDSNKNGKIPFTVQPRLNYELPATTQLVLSANSLMGRGYEACLSIKGSVIGDQLLYNSTAFAITR